VASTHSLGGSTLFNPRGLNRSRTVTLQWWCEVLNDNRRTVEGAVGSPATAGKRGPSDLHLPDGSQLHPFRHQLDDRFDHARITYRCVAITQDAIFVLNAPRLSGGANPRSVIARLPRHTQLGPVQGRWGSSLSLARRIGSSGASRTRSRRQTQKPDSSGSDETLASRPP